MNGWLDALAEERARAGLPALSVRWGASGDVLASDENLRRLGREGLLPVSPLQGIETLMQLQPPARASGHGVSDGPSEAAGHSVREQSEGECGKGYAKEGVWPGKVGGSGEATGDGGRWVGG